MSCSRCRYTLPSSQAKLNEMHELLSNKVPDVSTHVSGFVSKVDAELKPFLQHNLPKLPGGVGERLAADPVALQAIIYALLGAPVAVLLPLLACMCWWVAMQLRGHSSILTTRYLQRAKQVACPAVRSKHRGRLRWWTWRWRGQQDMIQAELYATFHSVVNERGTLC